MARKPIAPPNQIDVLQDVAWDLRDMDQPGMAGDIEAVRDCLKVMLELTKFGDCLFGDEIRNVLGVRHSLRPRRGTEEDPLRGQRRARRARRVKR